jgi:hypothetical protein
LRRERVVVRLMLAGDEKSVKRVQSFLISRLGNLITSNRITLISNHQPLNKHRGLRGRKLHLLPLEKKGKLFIDFSTDFLKQKSLSSQLPGKIITEYVSKAIAFY